MSLDCDVSFAGLDFHPRELPDRLRATVLSHSGEADHFRRLPAVLVEELRAAGAPTELGGFEVPVATGWRSWKGSVAWTGRPRGWCATATSA